MATNPLASINGVVQKQINKVKSVPQKANSIFKGIGTKISSFLNKTIEVFMKKPSEKTDYISMGKVYISKRAAAITAIALVILVVVFTNFFYPWADGNLWTANVKLNSEKYHNITGKKIKVKDQMGVVIYKGEMKEGVISGKGTQYNSKGELVYEGEFEAGNYSGEGKLYSKGILIYKGKFDKSLYEGEGELYNESGKLIYKGQFSAGQRSGKGVEYNPKNNKRIYYGEYANDLREGRGIQYTDNGEYILYDGQFVSGVYAGEGSLYEKGILKYAGAFENGQYSGEGTLYDTETQKVMYKGAFAFGLYEGKGVLYDTKTSKVIYDGEFVAGKRSGEGSTFDKLGIVSFTGEFKDDNINYLNYLGEELASVTEQFGKESYRTNTNDGKLVLTYISLNMSIVFKTDEDKGTYVCEKLVMGNKGYFCGLKPTSPKSEIIDVMGNPYSSVNYHFDKYYDTIFKQLSINLSSSNNAPSDKFLMDKYFVRFYYNNNRSEYLAIEVSSL